MSELRTVPQPRHPPVDEEDIPIHVELFNVEQLEAHARTLAAGHRVSADPRRARPLLPRLDRSAEILEAIYPVLNDAARLEPQLRGSEAWLRDNFHVVQDQVREIRQDLPRQYYLQLPKLASGQWQGYPRVYVLAREFVPRTGNRFDAEGLSRFVAAYQEVAPLSIGEVWAIPIMVRLALVETLRRLAERVMAARLERADARAWAAQISRALAERPAEFAELIDRLPSTRAVSPAFVVELLEWLRDQPPDVTPVWDWLRRTLDAQQDDSEEMIRREHQREAADQLAIGNAITSMRLLSALDWPVFFERVSLVERLLRQDPGGAYAQMDFLTRDRYRGAVEQLARRSGVDELDVARLAIARAAEARQRTAAVAREGHVGYYLISRGRFDFERDLGYRARWRERVARFAFRHPAIGYLGAIAVTLGAGVASLLSYADRQGADGLELLLVALVTLIPVSELAVNLVNRLFTAQVPPLPLPKLAMRAGLPPEARTMVVVPTMLSSPAGVRALVSDLEIRYLANRDPHLHFALLTDFADAPLETMPEDETLLDTARRGIEELNAQHGEDRFFLFHRRRLWNVADRVWMGWERKRGKLVEFGRVLRGAGDTSVATRVGQLSILPSVRYVITLDSDTQLPLNAARRLVGAIEHPLNQPRLDPRLGRVTEGYGVLQPRIGISAVSASRTSFARIYSGDVGLDPYTTAVSDVYQDLFHEGSYVGKGVYHVDAFQAALAGRVPPNALLSHDLFEGFFARAGLCTDVYLIDDFPPHYLAYAARQHRWARGDWQIVRWLWRTVPNEAGERIANTLPIISRWKILDNLRRSLLAPALVALLATSWVALPGSLWVWTTLAAMVLAFPAYVRFGQSLASRARGVPIVEHLRAERDEMLVTVRQALLTATFLAHQASLMADAIVRTLVRLAITRRGLLEWESAATAAVRLRATPADVLRRMWIAPAIAVALTVLVARVAPHHLPGAVPVLALWLLSPLFAYLTSRPLERAPAPLALADRLRFRQLARRTWRFFEDLVGPADHWLVPDNYQEDRRDPIAHRTSPTNIGLQLLSTLAAHDFGYVGVSGLLSRLEHAFSTLTRLERYRGHLYNWYDTQTLNALAPAYVSTVDSGNFAAALITLRQGLAQLVQTQPILNGRLLDGVEDGLALFEAAAEEAGQTPESRPGFAALHRQLLVARQHLAATPVTLAAWRDALQDLGARLTAVATALDEIEEEGAWAGRSGVAGEVRLWLDRVTASVSEAHADLSELAPWLDRLSEIKAAGLEEPPGAASLAALHEWCSRTLERALAPMASSAALRAALERSRDAAGRRIERAERLAMLADDFVEEIDFEFLFSRERQLFSIGYNVSEGRLDNTYYDMLASEARLATFVAIATGKIPVESWFKLGRALAPTGQTRALLSWSASMFEYLMPLLVMRSFPATLLEETYQAAIDRHIAYAAQQGVPWGISESAYNSQDVQRNYQYRAFGVPGLGLKRGLADDLVIAPYAALLAAPLRPRETALNVERLIEHGALGRYGLYEAIDYTPERRGKAARVVLPTFMAHHQAMSFLALGNSLHGNPMPARFHADPRVQSAELLLQERVPRLVPLQNPPVERVGDLPTPRTARAPAGRRYVTPHTLSPRTHLLSNGSYTVMVTNAGGGYSLRRGIALTRWRPDITCDDWGTFIYIRDPASGAVWSAAYQPTGGEPDDYEVTFSSDRAAFRRRDGDIEAHTEIVVSPEEDAEIRRVSVTNHSAQMRDLEITSYAEVVLAPFGADEAHPSFSNLFVETRAVPERDALLCVRTLREAEERRYLVHVMAGARRIASTPEHETSRARFLGRGRTVRRPLAEERREPLGGTTGPVLDPIVSLRHTVRLPPGVTARVSFTTGFADTEEQAMALIERFHDRRAVARAMALAGTHAQIELRHMNLTHEDVNLFQRFAARLLYSDPRLREREEVALNRRSQAELWKHSLSGDLPIVVVTVGEGTETALVRDLLRAQEYLRLKGFQFDLVVVNEHPTGYRQELQEDLQRLVEAGSVHPWVDKPGGVYVRRADLLDAEDRRLLIAAATAHLVGARGPLREQLSVPIEQVEPPPPLVPSVSTAAGAAAAARSAGARGDGLLFFNGFGGFTADGREYVLQVSPDERTPAPYAHVVANPRFGFVATEAGTGTTWSDNSRNNRLTPWSNDPVTDPPGEALFLRDEESGAVWSATIAPAPGRNPYVVRYGAGYAAYEHTSRGIRSETTVFVAAGEPVKIWRVRLTNVSPRHRRISATLYIEWVLGETRTKSAPHIVTWVDQATSVLMARNAFRLDFSERVAYLDVNRPDRSCTADRTDFLGRNGTIRAPAALRRAALSGETGATLDPCGALQVTIDLAPNEQSDVIFQLGEGRDEAHAAELAAHYKSDDNVERALGEVHQTWSDLLEAVQVRTPDQAADLLLNRWLLYQTVACRLWGRTAFYQSSGAFGFRDQLQDALALLPAAPQLTRAHILKAATRQFIEGDVQHWWHEPGGQGVRTRCSDDRLWLPYAALTYARATGDRSIFDERLPFLEGGALEGSQTESYDRPAISPETGSLYEHCILAIDRSLPTGAHGLPLMGSGDWNDGMNRVGEEGRGESVWLGWFLYSILRPFADLSRSRSDADRARRYRAHAQKLQRALERAWDGEWYLRAYFDDGTPLGSSQNEECRIDSIAQSWAVISEAAERGRARTAMEAVDRLLVRRDAGLICLLDPPFERMSPDPGYIKAYPRGVRENGGQYTHAALWVVMAFARLGDGDRAYELFDMLNPIRHAGGLDAVRRYQAEPYVVAADVYSVDPHVGRGGWTWYTGSAGWMYRVGLEEILGVTLVGGAVHIDPCVPAAWPQCEVLLRRGKSTLRILIENPRRRNRGVACVEFDGKKHVGDVPFVDDGREHQVRVVLGQPEGDQI